MRPSLFSVCALFAAAYASAMTPAAESFLKELGADPRSEAVLAVAADSVTAASGERYTLESLAAKRDEIGLKSFLVTRDFLRAFKEDPNIEFPNDELYNILYLSAEERTYIAKKLMEGLPKPARAKAAPKKKAP